MSYQQITINVNDAVAERLADALMEHGALSAAIEDAYAGTENEQAIFGEPGMPTEQIWQQSKVIALFGESDDAASIIEAAAQECGLNDLKYTGEILEDQDWVRLTQAQFDPIQISDRLWITPSWHEAPNGDAVNLQLDPGLAFGTGSHPTTRLCLKWLDTQLKGGENVLDYGCGSGILAIAALKLSAGSAIGVDIDEQAIRASKDNAAQNNVDAQFYLPDACRKANLMSLSPTFWLTRCVCSAKCLPRVPNKAAALSCPAFWTNKSKNSAAFTANGSTSSLPKLKKAGHD